MAISFIGVLFKYADGVNIFLLVLGVVFAMLSGSVFPLYVQVLGTTVNSSVAYETGQLNGQIQQVIQDFALKMVGLAVLAFVSGFSGTFCWIIQAERRCAIWRELYFASLLSQDMAWYEKQEMGQLSTRSASDVNLIAEGTGLTIRTLIHSTTAVIISLCLALYTSWRLTLVLLGTLPLPVVGYMLVWRYLYRNVRKLRDATAKSGAVATEALQNMTTVMYINAQLNVIHRYAAPLKRTYRMLRNTISAQAISVLIVTIFFFGLRAPILYYAGSLVLNNNLKYGDALSTFFQIAFAAIFFGNILSTIQTISNSVEAAQKVVEVIEHTSDLDVNGEEGYFISQITLGIEFRDVTFRYPSRPELLVLQDFNLTIRPSQKIALVGQSGASKSTILQLLLRMYEFENGEILIDGVSIRDINVKSLRQCIGVVSQEPVLFDATLYENVSFGASQGQFIDSPDVSAALAAAHALEFVSKLPDGLHTFLNGGVTLSGGQKQRIALARAIIRNPPILLLDEATSALDSKSEAAVQVALEELAQNRITLVVAHRLSTIKDADCIIVMNSGQVVETGSHFDLLQRQGTYAALYAAQSMQTGNASIRSFPISKVSDNSSSVNSRYDENEPLLLVDGKEGDELAETLAKRKFPYELLFSLCKRDPFYVSVALVGSVIDGLAFPLESLLLGTIFRSFSQVASLTEPNLFYYSFLFLPLAVFIGIGHTLVYWGVDIASENLSKRLRYMTLQKLMAQDMYYYDSPDTSPNVTATRLATDVETVKAVGVGLVGKVIAFIVAVGAGTIIALYYGWRLALFMVAVSPILLLGVVFELKAMSGYHEARRRVFAASSSFASDVCRNIKAVTMLGNPEVFTERYKDLLQPAYRTGLTKAVISGLGFGAFQTSLIIVVLATFGFAYFLITRNLSSIGDISIVIMVILFTISFVGVTIIGIGNVSEGSASAIALADILQSEVQLDIRDTSGRTRPAKQCDISLKDVVFTFPSRTQSKVLNRLSVVIPNGRRVAIVGASGAGKSTIALLLARIYDVQAGSIQMDNTSLPNWNLRALRSHYGVVGQEPILFNISIFENIICGSDKAQSEDVYQAAKAASIHDFIRSLPNGYHTKVGEMGSLLSTGQKQRIALARALVRKPACFIFDEATRFALDAKSEASIEEALAKLSKGITTVVISHRLRTIQTCDQICVVEAGQIVEVGTYTELIRLGGVFFKGLNAPKIRSGLVAKPSSIPHLRRTEEFKKWRALVTSTMKEEISRVTNISEFRIISEENFTKCIGLLSALVLPALIFGPVVIPDAYAYFLAGYYILQLLFWARAIFNVNVSCTRVKDAVTRNSYLDKTQYRHIFIIPNWQEDLNCLRYTMRQLAMHRYAVKSYTVVLAMEEREDGYKVKADTLVSEFSGYFQSILVTVHKLVPGEVKGKGANVNYASRQTLKILTSRGIPIQKQMVTVLDADSGVPELYITECEHALAKSARPQSAFLLGFNLYCNKYMSTPIFTRVLDVTMTQYLLARLATDQPYIMSNYTFSMSLIQRIGFWDAGFKGITEDSHMYCKVIFESGGDSELIPIYVPIHSSSAIDESASLWKQIHDRYHQGKRHSLGMMEFGYSLKRTIDLWNVSSWTFRIRQINAVLQIAEAYWMMQASAPFFLFGYPIIWLWGGPLLNTSLGLCLKWMCAICYVLLLAVGVIYFEFHKFMETTYNVSASERRSAYADIVELPWIPFSVTLLSLCNIDAGCRLLLGQVIEWFPAPKPTFEYEALRPLSEE
ncbi:hypothetical protein SmJEL517_g04543 [Synchytrium microbalum]|uniref:Uncharacterized protein n=1 Tax=Synchytrium microbalum TaxID=1806994 RepID=A0A507C311_9FUNG|nr:uncharacterized protein SmJEL517_g04543 [Synchytrium microbalum]TPX32336.1 hypothetical protein SmJEL517_g04543 [Synchytrium microbalum]